MIYPFNTGFIVLIPAILFALFAQSKVKSTFARYLRVASVKGYSGREVARNILDQNNLQSVPIEMVQGYLADQIGRAHV